MNADLINALFCAINTLQGTDGGFSPHEKQNAINILFQIGPEFDVAVSALNGFGHTLSVQEKREAIEQLQKRLAEEEKKEE